MAANNNHLTNLSRLCRVCGSIIGQKSKPFQVNKYIEKLKSAFWIDGLENDTIDVHPTKFCSKCYHVMNNIYTKKRTHSQTSLFIWNSHTNNCNVCIQSLQKGKGGRRQKKLHEGVNRFSFAQLWTKEITNSLKGFCHRKKIFDIM